MEREWSSFSRCHHQDVEKVLPELVHEVNEVKRVNYDGLIGVLIESVKTLTKRVEELENK